MARERELAFEGEDDTGWTWNIEIHIFDWDPFKHGAIYLEGLLTERQNIKGLLIERQGLEGLAIERQDMKGEVGTG